MSSPTAVDTADSRSASSTSALADYAQLLTHLGRIHKLETIAQLLGWDEQVNLPSGSADLRAEQHAVLAETIHAAASASELGEVIERLLGAEGEGGSLGEDERLVVREAQRDYERATKLPAAFVRAKAAQSSVGGFMLGRRRGRRTTLRVMRQSWSAT